MASIRVRSSAAGQTGGGHRDHAPAPTRTRTERRGGGVATLDHPHVLRCPHRTRRPPPGRWWSRSLGRGSPWWQKRRPAPLRPMRTVAASVLIHPNAMAVGSANQAHPDADQSSLGPPVPPAAHRQLVIADDLRRLLECFGRGHLVEGHPGGHRVGQLLGPDRRSAGGTRAGQYRGERPRNRSSARATPSRTSRDLGTTRGPSGS